jgi:hypothetical protein
VWLGAEGWGYGDQRENSFQRHTPFEAVSSLNLALQWYLAHKKHPPPLGPPEGFGELGPAEDERRLWARARSEGSVQPLGFRVHRIHGSGLKLGG